MYVIDAIGAVGADARGVVCGSMIIFSSIVLEVLTEGPITNTS